MELLRRIAQKLEQPLRESAETLRRGGTVPFLGVRKGAGTAFEGDVLKVGKYEKNVALMMPPPGSKLPGFIPDAVPGNPGELA